MRFRFDTSVLIGSLLFAGFVLVLFGGVSAQAQCKLSQLAKLLPDDGAADDSFGGSVSISDSMAIVGAVGDDDNDGSSGSAYLFDTSTGQQIEKLLPDDGEQSDLFGVSVAISGTTAIVGAFKNGNNGSAYLFDTTTGQQIAKLLPDGGAADDEEFGYSVSISGTTAIVSTPFDKDNGLDSGTAYLFDTTTGQRIARLSPDDAAARDRFGYRVSISGSTAIVGAYGDDDNGSASGSAYLFDTATGQQITKLLPDDSSAGDFFGVYVAISGTTAIVGASRDDDNGEDSGSAYLFDTNTGQQIARLLPNDGAANDRFGVSVSISGTTAIVGTERDDNGGGVAYLFDTTTGQQIAKILSDDGAAGDQFGKRVAISGATAIAGARWDDDNGVDSGSAYLFDVGCSDVVVPDSFLVTRGAYVSGGLTELADSDNMDLSLRRSNADIQSRTEFEVKGISPIAVPSSFGFTMEGTVFARSNVVQTIELFDYDAAAWELVDSSNAARSPAPDSVVTATPTGDLSRFVEAGTMCIQARVHFQSDNPRQKFASNTDQAVWTIGQ